MSFAVGVGGGALTAATPTTGADGVATVGSWVARGRGHQHSDRHRDWGDWGSPVTFTAIGQEVVVLPSQDTTLNGTIVTTRFEVPAGITVTLGSDVVIKSSVQVKVDGTIRGDCRRFEVDGSGELLVTGTVDNSCAAAGAAGKPLMLVARGGYSLNGATIRSSGAVELTNDPGLGTAALRFAEPQPTALQGWVGRPASLLAPPCFLANTTVAASPARAQDGAGGLPTGGSGGPGAPTRIRCQGLLSLGGGVDIRAQGGGDGGNGLDQDWDGVVAQGGDGGVGGELLLHVVGDLVFTGSNRLEAGQGGRGGVALAQAQQGSGPKAGGATASGGKGGDAGLMTLLATVILDFVGPTELAPGRGGDGGDGIAEGATGADAGATFAQEGGDATASGGPGGTVPDMALGIGAAVSGLSNVTVSGGEGGWGGDGVADGGPGGHGSANHAVPGDGGRMTATGGAGGESKFRRFGGARTSVGGDGGHAEMQNGFGGNGGLRCLIPQGFQPGVTGGRGGDMTGTHGVGGIGSVQGAAGGNKLVSAGGGGRGGVGMPIRGEGGQPGTQVMSKPPVISGPPPFQGSAGWLCLGVLGGATGTGYVPPPPGSPPTCRVPYTQVELVSFGTGAVTFIVSYEAASSSGAVAYIVGPDQFNPLTAGATASKATPAYDPAVHQLMGARAAVYTWYDYCLTNGPMNNTFRVTATAGGHQYDVGTVSFIRSP